MSAEKRGAARQDIRWKGLIVEFGGAIVGPCMIVNVSASGARLALQKPADVPDSFILLLSKNGVRRQCEVVWRSEKAVGVRFALGASAQEAVLSHLDDTLARIAPRTLGDN